MPLAHAFREKLDAGGRTVGTWHSMVHPYITELIAKSGLDAAVIDQEHGPVGLDQVAAATVILQAHGVASIVRVPWNDPVMIKQALDIGVDGVMIPNVRSVEEARAAVAACRYPPRGVRGLALGVVRAGDFGSEADAYQASVDESLVIILQVETVAAVDAIADIAAVDGVSMLFIGPNDLSADMGKPRQMSDPAVRSMIERAEADIAGSPAWLGTIPSLGRSVPEMFRAGCDFVCAGAETAFLREGYAAIVSSARGSRQDG